MAIEYQRWNIFFATMGNAAREKADNERSKIEKQRGIIFRFLENQCKLNSATMDSILQTMILMIENREPISDGIYI